MSKKSREEAQGPVPPPYKTWADYWADWAEDMYDRDWEPPYTDE